MQAIRRSLVMTAAVVVAGCASAPDRGPSAPPLSYAQYRPPAVCADSAVPRRPPSPLNYDDVRRSATVSRPDLFPRGGSPRIAFLWYFVREDGGVAETRLWRSSGSRDVDEVALEAGRQLRWQPATCGGQPVALWYGHPIALGGPY
jgi:hypothetical protein